MHEQREMYVKYYSEDLKERDTLGDLGINIKLHLEEM
jgi:hypothetical protein